jgi:hypothetical protein
MTCQSCVFDLSSNMACVDADFGKKEEGRLHCARRRPFSVTACRLCRRGVEDEGDIYIPTSSKMRVHYRVMSAFLCYRKLLRRHHSIHIVKVIKEIPHIFS